MFRRLALVIQRQVSAIPEAAGRALVTYLNAGDGNLQARVGLVDLFGVPSDQATVERPDLLGGLPRPAHSRQRILDFASRRHRLGPAGFGGRLWRRHAASRVREQGRLGGLGRCGSRWGLEVRPRLIGDLDCFLSRTE